MLHRFGFVEDTKAADGGMVGIAKVVEGEFFEAGGECGEFGTSEMPTQLAVGLGEFGPWAMTSKRPVALAIGYLPQR